MFKQLKRVMPKGLLWKLTSINVTVIVFTTAFIGWAVYETACSLNAGMSNLGVQGQGQFNATLLQYVLIIVVIGIVVSVAFHLHFTKKVLRPIKQLIDSTKKMQGGQYPDQINVYSEGELSDLVKQFNAMIEQLERNEDERNKIVTDLSHEIRTPLSNLSGYLKALSSGVIEGDQKVYSSLYQEANRMSQMIEQLNQLKEWDRRNNRQVDEFKKVDISYHIKQSVAMFQLRLTERNINIKIDVESQKLTMNPLGIEQVLNNILQNAIQYYDGDDAIVVKGQVLKQNDFYKVSVTGPSKEIPKEERSQIFNRLYRVDSSRSRETGGTGLGLAIAKEIVEYHHGSIGIDPNEHLNTVWFKIPLEPQEE